MDGSRCLPCLEPDVPMSAVVVAVVVVLALILVYYITRRLGERKDTFVSRQAREVCDASRELFERTHGNTTYSQYKTSIPTADAVLYTDARRLWKEGRLTPDKIQETLTSGA